MPSPTPLPIKKRRDRYGTQTTNRPAHTPAGDATNTHRRTNSRARRNPSLPLPWPVASAATRATLPPAGPSAAPALADFAPSRSSRPSYPQPPLRPPSPHSPPVAAAARGAAAAGAASRHMPSRSATPRCSPAPPHTRDARRRRSR
jgi:hypothetical protein